MLIRKGEKSMRQKRWIPGLLVVLLLTFHCFSMQKEAYRFPSQLSLSNSLMLPQSASRESPSSRNWWSLLYDNALLLARMDDGEQSDNETDETSDTVEYVWPLLSWLLSLLQPASAQ